MNTDLLINYEKKYDFKLIAGTIQQFLTHEGIRTAEYEPDESMYYDGVAVTYMEYFPILKAPVRYRIHYDSFYGEASYFSASIGVPRGESEISDMECRTIATGCMKAAGMMVSFEGCRADKKYDGFFHVIDAVYGKHIMDLDEMQQHMHEVKCVVMDIAKKLFDSYSEMYFNGRCDAHTTVAKFEQVDSMSEDDRVFVERENFEEFSYDPDDPINIEDTLVLTDLLNNK